MRFRLKSIFLLTLLVAMLLGAVLVTIRASARADDLERTVEASLDQLRDKQSLEIDRAQHQHDFGLFSSGTIGWDIRIAERADARIVLKWRSRLWFSESPTIDVFHDGKELGMRFSTAFAEAFQTLEAGLTVNEIEG